MLVLGGIQTQLDILKHFFRRRRILICWSPNFCWNIFFTLWEAERLPLTHIHHMMMMMMMMMTTMMMMMMMMMPWYVWFDVFRINFDIIWYHVIKTLQLLLKWFVLGTLPWDFPSSINLSTYLWWTVRRTSPQKDRPTGYEPSRQEKVPRSSGDQSVAIFLGNLLQPSCTAHPVKHKHSHW